MNGLGRRTVETALKYQHKFTPMMNTLIILGVLLLMLGFIFFVYLMLRRTAQGFKEGMEGR